MNRARSSRQESAEWFAERHKAAPGISAQQCVSTCWTARLQLNMLVLSPSRAACEGAAVSFLLMNPGPEVSWGYVFSLKIIVLSSNIATGIVTAGSRSFKCCTVICNCYSPAVSSIVYHSSTCPSSWHSSVIEFLLPFFFNSRSPLPNFSWFLSD